MEQENLVRTNEATTGNTQTVIVQQMSSKSNGLGVAGFVMALIGLVFCWVPVFGWIMWFLGLVFSFIGIFKSPRGLAIAGLVISLIGLIILIVVLGAIGAAVMGSAI